MEGILPSRAFGRNKQALSGKRKHHAFTDHRYHYNLHGFLHKRRGGGGASGSSGSSTSSSSVGGKTPAPEPAPVSVPPVGGTSPSKTKSPIPSPKAPKLAKLPQLPTPKSELGPTPGSIPSYPPGHRPYSGPGALMPIGAGGHNQEDGKASCIHPKGFKRLRCQKPDAIVVTLIAIISLLMGLFLIYKYIKFCKQRRANRRNRHEEDGTGLGYRAVIYDPRPQIEGRVLADNSNIGLAISTSEETFDIAREQARNTNSGSSPAENPSEVLQPRTMNLSPRRNPSRVYPPRTSFNRGRSLMRVESLESVASSLSSGMIRTAVLGYTFQDPTIINVPPSLANSQKNSERMSSSGDADISDNDDDGGRDITEERGRDRVEGNMESGDIQRDAENRSKSSSRKSSSRGPDDQSDNAVESSDRSARARSIRETLGMI